MSPFIVCPTSNLIYNVDENYNFTSNGTDQRKESGATFFGEKKERPMESVGEVKRKYKRKE
jgi:hypothetical protein